jgi:hypothetical protein
VHKAGTFRQKITVQAIGVNESFRLAHNHWDELPQWLKDASKAKKGEPFILWETAPKQVFVRAACGEEFYGKPGDYIVLRDMCDNTKDICVVRGPVFEASYDPVDPSEKEVDISTSVLLKEIKGAALMDAARAVQGKNLGKLGSECNRINLISGLGLAELADIIVKAFRAENVSERDILIVRSRVVQQVVVLEMGWEITIDGNGYTDGLSQTLDNSYGTEEKLHAILKQNGRNLALQCIAYRNEYTKNEKHLPSQEVSLVFPVYVKDIISEELKSIGEFSAKVFRETTLTRSVAGDEVDIGTGYARARKEKVYAISDKDVFFCVLVKPQLTNEPLDDQGNVRPEYIHIGWEFYEEGKKFSDSMDVDAHMADELLREHATTLAMQCLTTRAILVEKKQCANAEHIRLQ